MPQPDEPILYLASCFPKLSETFVYREALALKEAGWKLFTAGLRKGETIQHDDTIEALAGETVVVYDGMAAMIRDACKTACQAPLNTVKTACLVLFRLAFSSDLRWRHRFALPVQWVAAMALCARIRGLGIRHIHAHMAHAPTTIAMLAAHQMSISFSFTGHAVDLSRDRVLLKEKLKRAAFVSCISKWHQAFYQSEAARPADEYPIVRCGVDPERFCPLHTSKQGSDPAVILGVGRLVRKKGFDVLLQALANLKTRGIFFHAIIVGDGPERESLERQRNHLGLKDSVDFEGSRANSEIKQYLQRAELFVLPCRVSPSGDRDGIPVVFMEAMACEVCCVSGDLPTIRELIDNRRCGCLVEPANSEALTDCLVDLLSNPETRIKLACEGRQRVIREFSTNTNMHRLDLALRRVPKLQRGPQK